MCLIGLALFELKCVARKLDRRKKKGERMERKEKECGIVFQIFPSVSHSFSLLPYSSSLQPACSALDSDKTSGSYRVNLREASSKKSLLVMLRRIRTGNRHWWIGRVAQGERVIHR